MITTRKLKIIAGNQKKFYTTLKRTNYFLVESFLVESTTTLAESFLVESTTTLEESTFVESVLVASALPLLHAANDAIARTNNNFFIFKALNCE